MLLAIQRVVVVWLLCWFMVMCMALSVSFVIWQGSQPLCSPFSMVGSFRLLLSRCHHVGRASIIFWLFCWGVGWLLFGMLYSDSFFVGFTFIVVVCISY